MTTQLIPFLDSEFDSFCDIVGRSNIFKVKCKEEVMAKALWAHSMGIDPIIGLQMIDLIQGNPAPSGALIASRLDASDNYAKYIIMQSARKCVVAFYIGAGLHKSSPYIDSSEVPELGFYEWIEAVADRAPGGAFEGRMFRLEEGNLSLLEMGRLKHYMSQGLRPGVSLAGIKEWTVGMAKEAGLTGKGSWKSHADSMLLWRCISNGYKAYASDLWQGGKVYVPEELGEEESYVTSTPVPADKTPETSYIEADYVIEIEPEPAPEPAPEPVKVKVEIEVVEEEFEEMLF